VSIANLDFLMLRGFRNEPQNTSDLREKITLEVNLKNHRVDFEKP